MPYQARKVLKKMVEIYEPGDVLPPSCKQGVVTIGNFDGVHRGHRRLLARLRTLAREQGLPAVAVTFEPHPLATLRPTEAPTPLMTVERRCDLLLAAGVDQVVVLSTRNGLLNRSADAFFREVLQAQFEARGIVEGPNFCFGKNRTGTPTVLKQLGDAAGIKLTIVPLAGSEAGVISSSRIRELLADGSIEEANALLGRPHRVSGTVGVGDQRGRTIGFPTANVIGACELLPADGVYRGVARTPAGHHLAAINIGPNPTFGVKARKVEAHLLDFSGDLYGQSLELDFLQRLRATRPFASVEQLTTQLQADVSQVRAIPFDLSSYNCKRSELALTIGDWLEQEWAQTLAGGGCRLRAVRLESDGLLRVHWQLNDALLPSDWFALLSHVEPKILKVFPEVRWVEMTTNDL